MKPLFAVINSGGLVSNGLDCTKIKGIRGMFVPSMVSADLLLQGGWATGSGTTPPGSGDYARFLETRGAFGSGDLRLATGPGSRYVPWPFGETLPPYLRLESTVSQTNLCTLTLLTR